jgi:type IV pilus assembly protein PilY1
MNPLGHRPLRRLFARSLASIVAFALIALPTSTLSDIDADLFLFTTSVPPNVVIVLDNSGSMNHLVWHPAYDPTATYSCTEYDNDATYGVTTDERERFCDNNRTIYHDNDSVGYTLITGHYLNWLFSDESDAYVSELEDNSNGTRACRGPGSPTYAKYQRNRLSAAKQVVLDTICRVEATKAVRFGLAVFRAPNDTDDIDPNGGYLEVGIADNTPAHASDLEASIANSKADTSTPLGETLFQVYTYFMGRDDGEQGPGATGGTTFPKYRYSRSPSDAGGKYDEGGPPNVPDDPLDFSCQKNFVIIITDGEPTMDDFDQDPGSTAHGFDEIEDLVGDYDGDGETEIPGNSDEQGFYLDDIAKLMNEKDFRPDLDGNQTIDTYTIGFTTQGAANDLLEATAENGNGIFFTSNNAEELTESIVKAITDIIEKSQSFTAATVPSTRTASGGDFYTSFFLPTGKTAFWQGHLRAFGIDASGNIFDKDGNCPLVDLDAGECNSGGFVPGVEPFWDAGKQVPVAGSRSLYTTKLSGTVTNRVNFDNATLAYSDLTLSAFAAAPAPAPNPIYPSSAAQNAEGLSEEIISYVRGCEYTTGVSGANVAADVTCTNRGWRLGDIFHSAPVIVGRPNSAMGEAAYAAYAETHKTRRRTIYAGANDGFLHAFDAGTWNAAATPPAYTRGSGAEVFGFMPWEPRKQIKNLPIDDPTARHYYVDGSPQAADVWIHPAPTTNVKAASGNEYRTRIFAGLRQGGRTYFSLDVTDPSSAGFPQHVWDFPDETDPDDPSDATSILPYLGEAWSQPIITRVRVAIDGNNNGGYGFERWVMVITGGYHTNGDPNDFVNYDASAVEGRAILIVDVKSGELLAMKKFTTSGPASDPQRDMKFAIPSTPAVYDLDFDGFADIIMVGDLGGQVWKWVVKNIGEDRVNDSSSAGDYSQPNWALKKFFTAPVTSISGDAYYKSIYYPPGAAFHGKDLWYSFGTGERNNIRMEGIASKDENNRIYAIRDRDPHEASSPVLATLAEGDLTDLSSTESCTSIATPGYYFKLADGEKVVTNVEIFAGFVLTGTFTPENTGDPCTSKGVGNLYVFDVECGGGHYTDAGGNPTRAVYMGEGMPTDPQVSVGVDGKDNIVFVEKSGADLESLRAPDIPAGGKTLLYWREIY